jgi:hypothetical protein
MYFGILWLGIRFGYFTKKLGDFFPNHLVTLPTLPANIRTK